jgi:predicted DsbA family dithiol-disulfide isomerase
MERARTVAAFAVFLALFCLGASCSDRGQAAAGAARASAGGGRLQSSAPGGDRVEEIAGIDVGDLTSSERRTYFDLVNEQLSPCGQPISVARCANEPGACRRCVPAARYLLRLVSEGYEKSEIEEFFSARYAPDKRVDISVEGSPVRGAPMAPVTIVEFSDFECPHCARAAPLLHRTLREFEGRVKLVFKQYPLDQHPRAAVAARASIAAGRQGKFWEMHDLMFENQRALEDDDLERYATQLGLDLARFRADMASAEAQARVDQDRAEGRRVGVQGTPTVFVNGRRFGEPLQALGAYLREELDE